MVVSLQNKFILPSADFHTPFTSFFLLFFSLFFSKSILLGGVMSGAHAVFEIDDLADISANEVVLKLISSGGAHAATTFDL